METGRFETVQVEVINWKKERSEWDELNGMH